VWRRRREPAMEPRVTGTPVHDAYFADPFLLAHGGGFVAYGSPEPSGQRGASFEALVSDGDLRRWRSAGTVLAADERIGTDYWAPEVARMDGAYWMVYSAGRGIAGHHLRVARADVPDAGFVDQGVNLTPDEPFAIDANQFRDADGQWYVFFAHDVLDAERPGTHLAVAPLESPTRLGPVTPILEPNADWQMYQAARSMYGRTLDWYTLEGPSVTVRDGRYYCFFSGGSWEGSGYGVSYAVAEHPLGPWRHAADQPVVLNGAATGLVGPGHCSVLDVPDGRTLISYHAWNQAMTKRQMHIDEIAWTDDGPVVQPLTDPTPGADASDR
jgi:arabinan endo-1,5-alpha-L-arabinosidase